MKLLKTVKEDSYIYLEEQFAGTTISTRWRPYTVGNLPNHFGCTEFQGKECLNEWFNHKGYTYVRD